MSEAPCVVPGLFAPPPRAKRGSPDVPRGVATAVRALWVHVVRFEAQEPMGVSEIKRDLASGGALFCLRRNALGYGLYEEGVESVDGPLLLLTDRMSLELRGD